MTLSNEDFSTIAALDLDPIKVKLMHEESGEAWSRAQADAVEFEYRRFLYLMKKYPTEHAAPRMDVDIFWHYHILDTMKYAQDCQAVFGYFLHHFPYIGLRGADDLEAHHRVGARMRTLYEETFGEEYVRAEGTAFSAARAKTAWSSGVPGTAFSAAATATAFSAATNAVQAAPAQARTAFSAAAPATAFSAATVATAFSAATSPTAFSAATSATAFSAATASTAFSAATNAGHADGKAAGGAAAGFFSTRPTLAPLAAAG